jgi:hypothetical protein
VKIEELHRLGLLELVRVATELEAENEKLRAEIDSRERQLKEWYEKLQGADANWAEAERKLKTAELRVLDFCSVAELALVDLETLVCLYPGSNIAYKIQKYIREALQKAVSVGTEKKADV